MQADDDAIEACGIRVAGRAYAVTPEAVGGLIYLFEKAVGIGGRLLGVNPFDQPGVEAYKREMFRLLGKP